MPVDSAGNIAYNGERRKLVTKSDKGVEMVSIMNQLRALWNWPALLQIMSPDLAGWQKKDILLSN